MVKLLITVKMLAFVEKHATWTKLYVCIYITRAWLPQYIEQYNGKYLNCRYMDNNRVNKQHYCGRRILCIAQLE